MNAATLTHVLQTTARRVGSALAVVTLLFAAAVIATARWGDRSVWPPAPGAPTAELVIVSHGYHAGVLIPRGPLAELASRRGLSALGHVASRFAGFEQLEIGWGDEGFYRATPSAGSFTVAPAIRALFRPGNASVLHVVGITQDPRTIFGNSDLVRIAVSEKGFERVADMLDTTLARGDGLPEELGPGLYGTSLFFRANGTFHIFNVCNHWTASVLDAAGVPTAPVLATLPHGLLLDLEWRSGLARLPPGAAMRSMTHGTVQALLPTPESHDAQPQAQARLLGLRPHPSVDGRTDKT